MTAPLNIFWFRRDLRLNDNTGLYNALKSGLPVLPVFIFDKNILDKLADKNDSRVTFIHDSLMKMQSTLINYGSSLKVFYGNPETVFETLASQYTIENVFTNHDYEGYGIARDENINKRLSTKGIKFHSFKDQVIFERDEVMKDDSTPYTVFTPYSKKWRTRLLTHPIATYQSEKLLNQLFKTVAFPIPSLQEIGFERTEKAFPNSEPDAAIISHYAQKRDIPSINSTSKLGIHLRFGTISIRELALKAIPLSDVFINELIWRDFYHMIAYHFPHINNHLSFKRVYDDIVWRNNESEFNSWCKGQTGYPIVDAGMRELNNTGFMHNRVRMIVASFLCKHLLIDWRWGEAYFAEKLLDFDFAANNGGWQWAAGSGCDAAPYFRIFNPYLQTKKFDPELKYIRKWVPEFEDFGYTKPIVDHEFARKRCLETYGKALKK